MLFDPKWNQPSVAGFKAWLERQPRDKTFNYYACTGCAADQYLNSIGSSWYQLCKDSEHMLCRLNSLALRAFEKAFHYYNRMPTFGDVLDEINEDDYAMNDYELWLEAGKL